MNIKSMHRNDGIRICLLILVSLIIISLIKSPPAYSAVSYHIPIHSSLEEDIQVLQGMGYMKEIFTGTRPYSRLEVAKAIERLREGQYPQVVIIILRRIEQDLQEEIALLQGSRQPFVELTQIRVQAAVLDGTFSNGGLNSLQSIKYNDGRKYGNGLNLYGGISLLARYGDSALIFLNPEFQFAERRASAADESYLINLREGYFKYHTYYSDIMIGNVPLWWGQGYNGALILTNNIQPLTMLRLFKEAPYSITLPFHLNWELTYDFFISRLEYDRELPRPVLWGLRIGLKPFPSLEIGLSRTAMFGGGDRPVTLKLFGKSFTGTGENTPSGAGNQIGGLDMSYKKDLWSQPINIYAELYGEDEAGSLPSKHSYLAGVHLPDIAGLPGNSLRIEYADNTGFLRNSPGIWYNHSVYSDGYTYKGRIIGHGMGSDADNLFVKWEKYFSADIKGSLSFERNRRDLFNTVIEEARDYSIGAASRIGQGIDLTVKYTLQDVDNFESQPDMDFKNNEIWVIVGFEP